MKLSTRKGRSLENIADENSFTVRACRSTDQLDWSQFQEVNIFDDANNKLIKRKNITSCRRYSEESLTSNSDEPKCNSNNNSNKENDGMGRNGSLKLRLHFDKAKKILRNNRFGSKKNRKEGDTHVTEDYPDDKIQHDDFTDNSHNSVDMDRTTTFVLTQRFIGWKV